TRQPLSLELRSGTRTKRHQTCPTVKLQQPFEPMIPCDLTIHGPQLCDVGKPPAHLLLITHYARCSFLRRNVCETSTKTLSLFPTAIQCRDVIGVKQIHSHPAEWIGMCDMLPQFASLHRI